MNAYTTLENFKKFAAIHNASNVEAIDYLKENNFTKTQFISAFNECQYMGYKTITTTEFKEIINIFDNLNN